MVTMNDNFAEKSESRIRKQADLHSPMEQATDSINRLLQYQRGTLNSTGGYQGNGGGESSEGCPSNF